MKGVIFNLVEDVVVAAYGHDAWDNLLDRAAVEGTYSSLGSYPDAELMALVAAASEKLGLPEGDLLHWIGAGALPLMAARWPEFFSPHLTLTGFLRSLNSVIHPEVHKLYPGARCPLFAFGLTPDGGLLMDYRSPRKLCRLAEGFIEGAAAHYQETAKVSHQECMHEGDARCLLFVNAA